MFEHILKRLQRGDTDLLLAALEDPRRRLEAMRALHQERAPGDLREPLVEAVLGKAGDADAGVREEVMAFAAEALRELESLREALLQIAVAGLTDETPEVRNGARAVLAERREDPLRAVGERRLDRKRLATLLGEGEVSPEVIDLLALLGTRDTDLRCDAAVARGYEVVAELPPGEPWAWRAAARLCRVPQGLPEGEPPEALWATYSPLLVRALGDARLRREALDGLEYFVFDRARAGAVLAESEALLAILDKLLRDPRTAPDAARPLAVLMETAGVGGDVLAVWLSESAALAGLIGANTDGDVRIIDFLADMLPGRYAEHTWGHIEDWLATRDLGAALPGGATEAALGALEAQLGQPLPRALRASLRRRDGCRWLHGGEALSANAILHEVVSRMANAAPAVMSRREHDPELPALTWCSDWLPIWAGGDGALQAVELSTGRVLYASGGAPLFRAVRSPSYCHWLQQALDDLREDAYVIEDGAPALQLPVWPRT
jgi:hypothetical protein